jgi:sec-independent protein translocase protein TatC
MQKRTEIQEVEMPFLEHLEELRWRLIKSFVAILVLTIISFYFSGYILDTLLYTVKNLQYDIHLQVLKVQSVFIIKLEIALIFGIVLALPVIFYQIYAFVAPGLLRSERKYVWPVIIFATLSFIAGAAFAYFLIVPLALDFFLSLAPPSVTNNIALDFFFGFVARLVLVFGVVFELPVVSLFLTKIGLLSPRFLKKYRRHAIVVMFILAAVLTPPDPTTQIMLAIPLLALYEATIWISYFFYKKKDEKA